MLTTEQQIEQAAATGTPAVFSRIAVDGSFLADLLSGRIGKPLHPKGLDLTGAQVVGCDWTGVRFRTSLSLTKCTFDQSVLAHGAQVDGDLKILDCTCPGIDLTGARISGDVILNGTRIVPDASTPMVPTHMGWARVSGGVSTWRISRPSVR